MEIISVSERKTIMKKILFTGGTGFLGRNLISILSKRYYVSAPTRSELDLKDTDAVEKYIKTGEFDVVIHAAIPNLLSNQDDIKGNILKDSLRIFMNLERLQNFYGKLLYFGSGAEFNKEYPIILKSEEMIYNSVPVSDYGLAKYVMNQLSVKSKNIYNLRIFGCFGPTDAYFKLITYAINCCLDSKEIVLKQNCIFDYMYVEDLVPILDYFINNVPRFHDYNICTGRQTELIEICKLIQKKLDCPLPIVIEKDGFNNEYTGDNSRLLQEIPNLEFTSLSDGIEKQINYEKGRFGNE